MLIALLVAQAAMAPMAAPACPATPVALPATYAGWSAAAPVVAATEPALVGDAMLRIGQGARATLQPAGVLKLPVALTRPLAPTAHGGLFAFEVAMAGRYRVALGAGVWIDVVANGLAAPSVAHGHGPDCTAVRKYVDWDLKPGRYLLQVAGGEAATLQLEVLKAG